MKTTIKNLKTIINEAMESTLKPPVRLGGMSANIAGDWRYTDNIVVDFNPNDGSVTVTVSSQGPVGGMDYDSGGKLYDPSVDWQQSTGPNAKPAEVMKLLKIPLSNDNFNFRRYGKPTKNFRWDGIGRGLSIALVKQAIDLAKSSS